jgi:hypothetical protein
MNRMMLDEITYKINGCAIVGSDWTNNKLYLNLSLLRLKNIALSGTA